MGSTTRALGSRIRAWADRAWSGPRPDEIAPTVQLVEPIGNHDDIDAMLGAVATPGAGDGVFKIANESQALEYRIRYIRLERQGAAAIDIAFYLAADQAVPGQAAGTGFKNTAYPYQEFLELYVSAAGATPYNGFIGVHSAWDGHPLVLQGSADHPVVNLRPGHALIMDCGTGVATSLSAIATIRSIDQ